jgi:hypothetical protein
MAPKRKSYQWRANRGRTPPPPRRSPAEAQARLAAEHARRQAEQETANAQLRAELAAEKAKHDVEVDRLYDAFLAGSRWIDHSTGNGYGDPRNIDRTIN